jgi:hypothetical protein
LGPAYRPLRNAQTNRNAPWLPQKSCSPRECPTAD